MGAVDGQRSEIGGREAPLGEHVVGGPRPRARKVAPWWWTPEAWTPWNWKEATEQYQTFRKTKSQI